MVVSVMKMIFIYSLLNTVFVFNGTHSMQFKNRLGLGGNETDRLALLAIKAQINHDPFQVMSSWNESIHFCLWRGITCSGKHHQRVIMLDLESQNLLGSISPHIGNLSFLRTLQLQNNSFRHQIPSQIGSLHRLQVLRLDNNSLSGHIPYNISNCLNLKYLDLGYNKLVGKIPSKLDSLSKLQILVFQYNDLTGDIPHSLGNLSSLEVVACPSNNFFGSIPDSLGQLKKLTYLSLGFNKLSGTISPSIYNLSNLLTFDIAQNRIQGIIPTDFAKTLPNLQEMEFFSNQFTGPIPLSISNATSLEAFEVADNKLTGKLPNLRKLHNLVFLNIQFNHLGSGKDGDLSFLSDLSNATELKWLILSFNNFGGTFPTSVSNISTKLEILVVQANQLHGSIPAGIGNLVSLQLLTMGENSFTGNIPVDIGKLTGLGELNLKENKLSGKIPSALGNLTKLTTLALEINNLQGSIPASLGECRWLLELDLSQNNLSGTIPKQVIGLPSLSVYLKLFANHFTGSLPQEVGKLKNLGTLDVSDNKLSGQLPSSLGSCASLEVVHLQGNFFKGSIPSSMYALRGIRDLDLSRNNLSGEIPKFLQRFGNLKRLNLSFNEFWGAVPSQGIFRNASMTWMAGNTSLCGGIAHLRLPKCNSQKYSKRKGLSRTFKLVLSLAGGFGLLGILIGLSFLFLCSSRKKSQETAMSDSMNSILQVSYASLLKATEGFSSANLIGMGSFGSVYKGILSNGNDQLVAVKVFNLLRQGASKSFLAECEALRNIRHRNLVRILTACSSVDFPGNDFKALVYEYMEKGSLDEWLHPTTGTEEAREASKCLNLVQRLDIAIDVACALDYLHNHCETPIVHCDLKPSNVLLDNSLTGLVSDFGLAKFLSTVANNISANQTSSIGIRGSVGYAAPEYGMGSEVTTDGDVYSFGILLLEMFTGKRPTDDMFRDNLSIHNFVKMAFPERVTEICDPILVEDRTVGTSTKTNLNQYSLTAEKIKEFMVLIFRIGIRCSAESPRDRRNISDVVSELHSIRGILK